MFYDNLAELILRAPQDGTNLDVVSGYASPSALLWCLSDGDPSRMVSSSPELKITQVMPKIRLLIGMAGASGVTRAEHEMYMRLCAGSQGHLEVRYPHPNFQSDIHTKAYLWKDEILRPLAGFSGSANMTNAGMGIGNHVQENVMSNVDPVAVSVYFEQRYSLALDCLSPGVEDLIDFPVHQDDVQLPAAPTGKPGPSRPDADAGRVKFYLYKKREGQAYEPGGGINWGHRGTRDRNEAYAAISAAVSRSDFLPLKNTPITVHCDDGEILVLRGASGDEKQPSGKDLTSIPSNATLGAYLRGRMGLQSGQYVGMEELSDYGRAYFTLSRLQSGDYYLDFSALGPGDFTGLEEAGLPDLDEG
ncbi:restriction endonuclease PLD domain-containing protein [Arthrobacter sp. N1]|uniref:restriction endonuclease PLD domain-containing protein n=1 Tax=Arthrobacter sp. N1 TaxID=619291 RepID=UPI003BB0EB80